MKVRKLNENGIEEFERYIDNLQRGGEQNYPSFLLNSPEHTADIGLELELMLTENLPPVTRLANIS